MSIFVLLWTLLPTPTDGVRGFTAATRLGGHNLARRRCATPRFCYTEPDPELDLEIDGPSLNEELTVSVQYLGGADSRQRRVRRTNRPPAEERWRLSTEEATDGSGNYIYRRMSAFCNYASIDVEAAIDLIANNEAFRRFGDSISITSYSDVVHVRMTSPPTSATASTTAMRSIVRDAYLLPYGATVLWGFQSRDELDFIDLIAPCSEPLSSVPYSGDMASEDLGDSDFMLYTLDDAPEPSGTPAECATDGGMSPPSPEQLARDDATGRRGSATVSLSAGAVTLSNKLIRISSTDDPVEKLAISFAFAQSVKLGFFEALLESTTEAIKPIPEQLAAKGSTNIDIKQVAKLTGRLFLERNEVNLYSNILDIPDFFWEAEEFEPLYLRVSRYLDIDDRVVILNKRLDIVNDLLDSLSAQLEVEHANRLEWIIIWLISVEIALELLKDFGGLDADGNGALDRDELKRALMLIGLQKIDFDAAFDALDIDGDGMVTFEEFNAALPSSTRAAIVARINEDGVLPSLYLPPEQWSETRSQAELQWEQKVQFQALRSGNKLRQNDILQNELGKL